MKRRDDGHCAIPGNVAQRQSNRIGAGSIPAVPTKKCSKCQPAHD